MQVAWLLLTSQLFRLLLEPTSLIRLNQSFGFPYISLVAIILKIVGVEIIAAMKQ